MDVNVRKYNNQIRELLDLIDAELPNNSMVATIHRRFRVALSIDRTYIIEETSPELLLYRDYIAEDRIEELIQKNWEAEIDKTKDELMYEIDNNSLRDMVGLLRQLWENYATDQRAYVYKSLKKLLSYCIKYHKAKADGIP
jgi:hypothetical protein